MAARKRLGRWLIPGVAFVLLLGLGATAMVFLAGRDNPEVTEAERPIEPEVSTPTPAVARDVLGDLYYPGAVTEPGIRQGKQMLLKLSTPDPVSKVLSFYQTKLADSRLTLNEERSFSLIFERGVVSSKSEGGKTEIWIALADTAGSPVSSDGRPR